MMRGAVPPTRARIFLSTLIFMSTFLYVSSWTESSSGFSVRNNNNLEFSRHDAINPIEKITSLVTPIIDSLDDSQGEISLRRHLTIGDFEELNQLFKGAVLSLPDTTAKANLLFTLTLDIRNLKCTDITVGDILITYEKESNQRLNFRIDIVDLDITCFLDYDYKYSFTRGSGSAQAYTGDNSASVAVVFVSDDFDTLPPKDLEIASCSTNINIVDLDFNGGFIAAILDTFERLIRGVVQDEVRAAACDELRNLGDSLAQNMLDLAENFLVPYTLPLLSSVSDPLYPENNMVIPGAIELLNFQDTESELGGYFEMALSAIDNLLGKETHDQNAPSGTGKDLGINSFLRNNLLDADRAFVVNVDDLDFATDGVLYEGHDQLTQTTITLDSVKVKGLDTFTRFEALLPIGNQTLQNNLEWSYIAVEAQLTIDIRPSTLPDSMIANPGAERVIETIQINVGADNIEATVSLLLAIDQSRLGGVTVGSLLSMDNIMSCLLFSLFQVQVSGIDVTVENVREPSLNGFVSPGIDRVVSKAVKALFEMYEPMFLDVVPNMFQTTLRDVINNDVIGAYLLSERSTTCSAASFSGDFIDFRDLLLSPEDASVQGASGEEPYGELGSTVMSIVHDMLLEPDTSGFPGINSVLIAPLTKSQSGTKGTLAFNDTVFEFVADDVNDKVDFFINRFQFTASNIRILDLDTITEPFTALHPEGDPHVLTNKLNLGLVPDRALTLKMRLFVELEKEGSPLAMKNELDIIVKVPTSMLNADILAMVNASSVAAFPLEDILDMNCWLATLPQVMLNEHGSRVASDGGVGFGLAAFALDLSGFSLDAECIACESIGAIVLPDLIKLIDQTGGVAIIRNGVENLISEVALSDWLQTTLDRLVYDGPRLCPHSPGYVEGIEPSDFGGIGLPNLSRQAVETIVLTAAMAAEIGFVVFSERHRRSPRIPTDPLSGQSRIAKEKQRFVDFTNLSNTFLGQYADMALDGIRNYVGETVEAVAGGSSGVRLNGLLRDYLFQDGEALNLEFANETFTVGGVRVTLHSLRFVGLDSATALSILDPIGPQTLGNKIAWDHLALELNVELMMVDAVDPIATEEASAEILTLSVGIEDVALDLALLLAMDESVLGGFELGALLQTSQILPCLLSKIDAIELTQMSLSLGKVTVPTLEGFLSAEMTEKISESVRFVFETYQEELIEALPFIVDESLRVLLNGALEDYRERENVVCQTYANSRASGAIDFRDLFLSKDRAIELGGSGDAPYGTLVSFVKKLINKEFLAIDTETGESKVNEELIRPISKSLSGVEGSLIFTGELASIELDDAERFGLDFLGLRIFDARLDHIDTVGNLVSLLEPNITSGQALDNAVVFGIGSKGVIASTKLLLEASGDSELATWNELHIGLEIRDAAIALGLLARMREKGLMSFPLEDVLNIDCWLSTFEIPELDDNGFLAPGASSSMHLTYLAMAIENLSFNITCTNCTSEGLSSLSDVTDILEDTGAMEQFEGRLVSLASDLLKSDFVQVLVDRLISDSSKKCHHSSVYSRNYTAPSYGGPSFPALSRESVETVVFTGSLALDIAVVLLAMSHQNTEIDASPLSGQDILQATTRLPSLLDLTALEDILGSWADSGIDELNSYLGGKQEDLSGPMGDSDLGINILLRSLVLDENRDVAIQFEELFVAEAGMELRLKELRIRGLDTFTEFRALDTIAPQTLQNEFGWEHLSVEVDISVITSSPALTDQRKLAASETITLSLGVSDVRASLALLLAIDQDRLGALELGSLLQMSKILPCFLSSAYNVELTELVVTAQKFDSLHVTGFLSPDLSDSLSNTTDTLIDEYEQLILEGIPKVFGVSVRALINNWMSHYINMDSNVACPSPLSPRLTGSGFIDFRDLLLPAKMARDLGGSGLSPYGDLLRGLLEIVNANILKIDVEDGTANINDLLIAPLTKSQSGEDGTLRYSGNLLDSGTKIDIGGLKANIGLKAYNGRIENVDSLGAPLSILDPVEDLAYILNNTASFGVGGSPLRFAITLLLFVTNDDDLQLRNEVDIALDLSSASVMLEALLKVAEGSFLGFPLRDFQNLQCWLATLPAPSLDSRGVRLPNSSPSAALINLAMSLANLNLNITCVSCSSPQMEEFATLLSTQAAVEDLGRVSDNLLNYATKLLGGEFLQIQIDRMIGEAPMHCPHRSEYDPNAAALQYEEFESPDRNDDTITFLITLAIVSSCLIGAVILVLTVVKCIVAHRNRSWVRTLPDNKVILLHRFQMKEAEKESDLNQATKSMFHAKEIPIYVRYSVPLVILANIGFFLSGHLSLGATVNVEATLAGETITVEQFFEFSMAQSTLDIWRAGGKELAILILIFSGVWPYMKQIITLFLWFTPTKMVSISKRGSILLWLDALAKWSMVDIFVLIVSVAAFRVSIQSPDVAFLPEGFYSVDLLVVPLWGLYANMIAQLISQISSHFIIHYHRRIVHAATSEYNTQREGIERVESGYTEEEQSESQPSQSLEVTDDRKEDLRTHEFARPHRGEKDQLIVRSGNRSALGAAAIIVTILVTVGCALPSFSLEVLGVLGVAIESGQEFKEAMTKHSVFTIVALLFEQASFLGTAKDFVGLGSLSILLILTVLIVPIAQALCLLRQWFTPLTQKQRLRLSIMIETLKAWQYVEVYLIAIIVSAWQLGSVSEFMINSYCNDLTGAFALLAYYGILDPMDAQCFRVQAGVEDGTYILVAAAVILGLMTSFVVKAVNQYDRDRSGIATLLEQNHKLSGSADYTADDVHSARLSITPPRVLFTDTFRWCLRRADSHVSQHTLQGLDEDAKLGVEKSFIDAARTGQLVQSMSQGTNQLVDVALDDFESVHSVMTPDDESCDLPRMYVDENLYASNQ